MQPMSPRSSEETSEPAFLKPLCLSRSIFVCFINENKQKCTMQASSLRPFLGSLRALNDFWLFFHWKINEKSLLKFIGLLSPALWMVMVRREDAADEPGYFRACIPQAPVLQ